MLQTLVALLALFSVVSVLIQWIYEYYTAQRIRMNKKLMEQRMKSSVDVLTGVFSRLAYHECLEQYADSVPTDLTVFLMDINGLKGVNDALGHEAGDELICGAAQCITQAVGDRGKIFRIGGDEFVVLGQMTQTQAQEILAGAATDCGGLVRDEGGDAEYFLRVRLCRRPSGFFRRAAYQGSRFVHVCPETGILPGKETVLWHTRL